MSHLHPLWSQESRIQVSNKTQIKMTRRFKVAALTKAFQAAAVWLKHGHEFSHVR
ncbi:MAG: hypothetical protein P8X79_20620 [Reinekea sp.]